MLGDWGAFKIAVAILLAIFVMAVMAAGAIVGTETVLDAVLGPDADATDRACAATFGPAYHAQGWSAVSNPPTIQCTDGETLAVMDMPQRIAEQKGINATAYHRGGGAGA